MHRRAIAACVVGATLALGGCASMFAPQSREWREAWRQGAEAGPAVIELDAVPFFPQTPYHCGPAALATVLTHAGIAAQPDDLARAVFVPALDGSLQAEMLSAPRARGALATKVPGELRALRRELLAGDPVVVLLNLGLAWQPLWHYAVVVGIDLDRGDVIMRSGATRRDAMPLATFELTWARAGLWAFVATTPGRWPASAAMRDAEDAAVGFERVAAPRDALRAYETLLERWPASFAAAMGRGNVLLALHRPNDAARAFERVAIAHDRAAAWNNLAVARARAGDTSGAVDAAQRALERARGAEPALIAAVQDTVARLQRGDVP
jgi:tetratricopeptide (TPR) repeat protein